MSSNFMRLFAAVLLALAAGFAQIGRASCRERLYI